MGTDLYLFKLGLSPFEQKYKNMDRPRFKPHVFSEFWQKWNFIFHKKRKPAKTHGSCKHIAHWCQILQHEPGTDLCLFKLGLSPFEPKESIDC